MSLILLNSFFKYSIVVICLSITAVSALTVNAIETVNAIKLEGLDGNHHRLSEHIGKGKWTVLNIWGPKCPPCREEMPDLVQFHDSHKDTNAIVVGIAIDFPSYGYAKKKAVSEFAEDFMIDFPLFLNDGHVTERLGLGALEGLPTTYIYTPQGKLVGMQVGIVTRKILETYIKNYKAQ